MKSSDLNLEGILDLGKWQSLQDSLAIVTKLAIITVDYKGVPITRHSERRAFCDYVRSHPQLESYCHKSDSRGGLEAVRTNAPYIYLCHCNIVDIAIPISVGDKYIGAVMAGEVRLSENCDETDLEQILTSPTGGLLDNPTLWELYHQIPVLSRAEIDHVARMLHDLCHYIVEEAMNKHLILELYEKMKPHEQPAYTNGMYHNYALSNIERLKKELGHVVTNTYIGTAANEQPLLKNPLLGPAFEYIYNNKSESVSQKQMAALCHISTGHFSRLFTRETGENFSAWLSRLKVEWSKQLLIKTDLSVTQISHELGFSDPGYYIKTFKKYESITPVMYRRYYNQ